ncbi:hypothetical protein WS90_20840 [Burkholderia cepacia]|uniref:Uncharacterized protein n=2 Tax=Burkholderia cepacia TaxID=292 RepID=A0A124SMK2_BURCE|nr:hypothetical protein WS90_20840 [Burkholderia cepacia]
MTIPTLGSSIVGFGAGGRNAGFSMKMFGLEPELVLPRWGKQKMIDAHRYLQLAVAHARQLIDEHGFQSAYCPARTHLCRTHDKTSIIGQSIDRHADAFAPWRASIPRPRLPGAT